MDTRIKNIIATVAPGLATLLGGPLAGTVVGALASGLTGNPQASEADVAAAIAPASPDVLAKLKEIETGLRTKLIDAGLDWEKLTNADRDGARQMQIQTRSRMPAILGGIAIVSFFGMIGAMWYFGLPIDAELKGALIMCLGMMRDEVKAIYSFVFGTTQSSADKNEIIKKALE